LSTVIVVVAAVVSPCVVACDNLATFSASYFGAVGGGFVCSKSFFNVLTVRIAIGSFAIICT